MVSSAVLALAVLAAPASATPLHAVCMLERPIIGYGEHVTVKVLTDAPASVQLRVQWSADGGALSQGSSPVSMTWTPDAQARGVFTIRARVVTSGETADCSTRIAVTNSLTRGANQTLLSTRTLLTPGAQETAGYGLYSYILFAARPTDQDRDRFEAVLASALSVLGESYTLEKRFPAIYKRPQLNVVYVPIAQPLPDDIDQRDDPAAWVRNNYDYDRAFAYLARLRTLPGVATALQGGTVWIVSCLHPLSGDADPRPFIPLNLSSVPLHLIPVVMQTFAEQATQPRDYNPYAVPRLRLDLRIAIGQLADGLQTVTAAFKLLQGG